MCMVFMCDLPKRLSRELVIDKGFSEICLEKHSSIHNIVTVFLLFNEKIRISLLFMSVVTFSQ